MSEEIRFQSNLSIEEIEENFKDFDFFAGMKEGLSEAIAFEKGKSSAETIARKSSLPQVNVAQIRTSLCMTQKKFASLLGVSSRTVEAWECGKSTPTPTAKKLMYLISLDNSIIEKII